MNRQKFQIYVGKVAALVTRVPAPLQKILLLTTVIYVAGFLWVFTHGHPMRLVNTAYWQYFWDVRAVNSTFGGRSYFYGITLVTVLVRWALIVGAIAAAYISFAWVVAKKKPTNDALK